MIGRIREYRLDNGLKALIYKRSVAPIVAVQVWYRTGSANEREGIRGISHFLEHMMFRGSEHVVSEEHARRINDCGGHCNAFTAEDVTGYLNSVPADHFETALSLEADRMRNLTLDPVMLETERRVIVEEFHTYMNNPVAKAFLEYREAFYGSRPYAISPLGSLGDLQAVQRQDLREYYENWYQPRNAVVVIAGDISSPDSAFESLNRHFGRIPEKKPLPSARSDMQSQEARAEAWMERRVDFDVPMVLTGYPAPAASHDDAVALDVMQMALSQGETSRMHREIVRRRSLAVMIGGMNHSLRLTGMSMFFGVFTPNIAARAVAAALDEQIERAVKNGIDTPELEKVRNAALLSRAFELQSTEQIAQRLGYAEIVEGDYRAWERRIKALETLDHDKLIRAARTHWRQAERRSLYLRPRRTKPLLFAVGLARKLLPFSR
jgi:predicted Zn-dependent peptidase